jgi:hypothetical protein
MTSSPNFKKLVGSGGGLQTASRGARRALLQIKMFWIWTLDIDWPFGFGFWFWRMIFSKLMSYDYDVDACINLAA